MGEAILIVVLASLAALIGVADIIKQRRRRQEFLCGMLVLRNSHPGWKRNNQWLADHGYKGDGDAAVMAHLPDDLRRRVKESENG